MAFMCMKRVVAYMEITWILFWYRVVYVECYVVGLIGFSKHTIYNMTTDFGNPRF